MTTSRPSKQTVTVYSTPNCQRCRLTKMWLDARDIPYTAVELADSPDDAVAMKALGYTEAPIVIVSTGDPETDIHWSGFQPANLTRYAARSAA